MEFSGSNISSISTIGPASPQRSTVFICKIDIFMGIRAIVVGYREIRGIAGSVESWKSETSLLFLCSSERKDGVGDKPRQRAARGRCRETAAW